MIFSIVFLVLLIFLIVEIVRYVQVRANAFSRAEVKKAAAEQAQKMKYKDPEITCDYCGGKIDTSKFSICPQCGAPYDKDVEWTSRHDNKVTGNFIDKSTDAIITAREQKSKEEQKRILRNIKRTIAALVAMIVSIFIVAVIVSNTGSSSKYRKNETLKDGTYYSYEKADYEVDGDGVIYDFDDVKITVTGFYKRVYEYSEDIGPVAVEFRVDNKRNEDIRISLSCNCYNGIASNSTYIYIYDTFKKNSSAVFYEQIRDVQGYTLSELIFDQIKIRNTDFNYEKVPYEPAIVKTTAPETKDTSFDEELADAVTVYSNEKVEVYALMTDTLSRDAYTVFIRNKSDYNMYVNSKDMKIDNMLVEPSGFYNCYLPTGYILRAPYVYCYSEEYKNLDGKEVSINLQFECKEEPSQSFSTGFINFNKILFK